MKRVDPVSCIVAMGVVAIGFYVAVALGAGLTVLAAVWLDPFATRRRKLISTAVVLVVGGGALAGWRYHEAKDEDRVIYSERRTAVPYEEAPRSVDPKLDR